ncbi:CotH kinase family protein [bacterium]|nr:CotH kinase family protein [bacterium]
MGAPYRHEPWLQPVVFEVVLSILPILAFLAATSTSPAATQAPVEILEIRLEMNRRYAKILVKKEQHDTSSFAVVVVDGDLRASGRIEIKGSSSRMFRKKSFKITMDAGQDWRGNRKVVLNAMATDLSAMREWLAWDLARTMGLPVPETTYVRVFINDMYMGLYFFIEWIDSAMLARRGLGGGGQFFHPPDGKFCGDLTPASLAGGCFIKLAPDDGDFSALEALVADLAAAPAETFDAWLDERFDAAGVIDWIALNTLTSMGDTYNKNYFLYLSETTGKWHVVPWDYDLSFGRNGDRDMPWPDMLFNTHFQYYYPASLGMDSPLKDKTLANPALHARLVARLEQVVGDRPGEGAAAGWFSADALAARVAWLEESIAPHLVDDSFHGSRLDEHDRHVEALSYYGLARNGYLRTIVFPARPAWVADTATAKLGLAGEPVHFVDGWGRLMATLTPAISAPGAEVVVEVEKGMPPEELPPGHNAEDCVQRTLSITIVGPGGFAGKLRWEYTQEFSRNTEVGPAVGDEADLRVWSLGPADWESLPTRGNTFANLLTVQVTIPAGEAMRFVACVSPS